MYRISKHLKSGTKPLVPQITLNFPSSWGCPPAKRQCESPDHQHHRYEVPERKLLEHSKSKVMMLPSSHPPPDKTKIIRTFRRALGLLGGQWAGNETYFHFHQPDSKQINRKTLTNGEEKMLKMTIFDH